MNRSSTLSSRLPHAHGASRSSILVKMCTCISDIQWTICDPGTAIHPPPPSVSRMSQGRNNVSRRIRICVIQLIRDISRMQFPHTTTHTTANMHDLHPSSSTTLCTVCQPVRRSILDIDTDTKICPLMNRADRRPRRRDRAVSAACPVCTSARTTSMKRMLSRMISRARRRRRLSDESGPPRGLSSRVQV
jgi:hypothetical protein